MRDALALAERPRGILHWLTHSPAWLDTVLADRPAGHVHQIRPYAHWHLLRRARRRAAQRRHPAEPGSFLRTRVLVALEFLAWLDGHGLDLGGLRQDHLDRWLDAGNTRTYAIRYFRATELEPDERAVLDQGVTVRRGQGYALRVTAAPAVHRQLLTRCQPLDGGQGTPTVPAQRKARREYENRVSALISTGP
ncbi:resolvase [Streptomyces niphimycinicus]|uniref:resolvase n=1 Tax=Streptomyces niphimycinicus TaxID=2842201 RepID=UPI00209B10E5|nr:resolvase [Streptomyces niphimycinicus]